MHTCPAEPTGRCKSQGLQPQPGRPDCPLGGRGRGRNSFDDRGSAATARRPISRAAPNTRRSVRAAARVSARTPCSPPRSGANASPPRAPRLCQITSRCLPLWATSQSLTPERVAPLRPSNRSSWSHRDPRRFRATARAIPTPPLIDELVACPHGALRIYWRAPSDGHGGDTYRGRRHPARSRGTTAQRRSRPRSDALHSHVARETSVGIAWGRERACSLHAKRGHLCGPHDRRPWRGNVDPHRHSRRRWATGCWRLQRGEDVRMIEGAARPRRLIPAGDNTVRRASRTHRRSRYPRLGLTARITNATSSRAVVALRAVDYGATTRPSTSSA